MTVHRRATAPLHRLAALALVLAATGCGGGSTAAPDPGALVLFLRYQATGSDLWAIREDGSGARALAAAPASENLEALTPDGRVVYSVSTDGPQDLWSVKLDGSDARAISTAVGNDLLRLVGPGGRLVVQVQDPDLGGEIVAMNSDGTGSVRLTEAPGSVEPVALTGDGRVVYQVSEAGTNRFWSVKLDGTGRLELLVGGAPFEGYVAAVTPAGRVILYVNTPGGGAEIHAVPAAGGPSVPLATDPALDKGVEGLVGERVVLGQRPTGTGLDDLWLVHADGSAAAVRLTSAAEHDRFAGSTPGGAIVYQRQVGDTDWDLHLVAADGTGDVTISRTTAFEWFTRVLPDGRILFQRQLGADRDVLLYDPAHGTTTTLATGPGKEVAGPIHGNRLVYLRDSGTAVELRAVDLDGTHDTLLAGGLPGLGAEAITPAGRLVFSTRDGSARDLYVVNLDGTGLRPLAATAPAEDFALLVP